DARSKLGQGLRFAASAVVNAEVAAALEQAGRQHRTHAAGANPAERLAVRRCAHFLSPSIMSRAAQTFVYHSTRSHSVANTAAGRGALSAAVPATVDPRTTNCGLKMMRCRDAAPFSICSRSSRAATAPNSRMGTGMVVSP